MDSSFTQFYSEWNQQGLIPGPLETEQEFVKRAQFCLNLQEKIAQNVDVELPFDTKDKASQQILEEAYSKTIPLYDMRPTWIPIFFNDYQLTSWHGGCAWIFQLNEQTPTSAFLQLRSKFRNQKKYLGLYERQELTAHELAHVGRMLYQEPKFEELLAYQTSSSPWRRWLGPIVQSSKESMAFILILGTIIMADLALLVFNQETYQFSIWLKLIPLFLILGALAQLANKHRLFNRCRQQLINLYQDSLLANHLLYRLTDKEIEFFASSNSHQIKNFILKEIQHSFRWHFLYLNYPFKID